MLEKNLEICDLTIVIPCYNEELNIPILYQRLTAVLSAMSDIGNYEIIVVENGSHDTSWSLLKQIAEEDKHIRVYKLSRNFGYQIAVTVGMHHSKGKNVIVMDGDLQDMPEFIPQLWNKKKEGYYIVYAVRATRKEGAVKQFFYKAFYRVLNRMSEIDIPLDAGDFAIYDRAVINQINKMPEKQRFVRGLRAWTGFKHCGIAYDRDARMHGTTKFNLMSMFKLASDGIFSFSYIPLRLLTVVGSFVAFLSIVGIILQLILKVASIWSDSDLVVKGITQVNILIIFFGGINLLGLGIIGEYLARVYEELKNRPLYIIEDYVGTS